MKTWRQEQDYGKNISTKKLGRKTDREANYARQNMQRKISNRKL